MDELLSKQTPHSVEAEQSVIGAILFDPACVSKVVELLQPEDFYLESNHAIYETISSMFTGGKKIDPVTVLEEMKLLGYKDQADRNYFLQLIDITPTSANVMEYARIVREKRMLRDLQKICSEIFDLTRSEQESAQTIAELAEQKIYAIRQGREITGLRHVNSVIKDVYDQLDELAANPGKLPGLPSGFSDLDNALGGLNKSDLILIAARPGMGKTSFALNIIMAAAEKSGKDVAVFQLEMSDTQLATRMLSSEALVDSRKLRMGTLNEEDWDKIAHASAILSKTNIYIEDNSAISVSEIKAKCRRLGDKLGLIVIDYLQLMQGSKSSENRVQQISEISRSLKIMAKELNVPVICLSQLSRGPEQRPNKRPMLSDLRESGAIEQDADIVLFLYRDDYYNPDSEKKNVVECIIAKNRHGEVGTIEMQWLGQYTRFSSQDKTHYEP
ncbi:replicative DNA helicase [Acidaminobacterium chupaoyuni]